MNRLSINTKRTLFGLAFGLTFPMSATLLEIWAEGIPATLQSALAVQINNPILWIVDTAPLVLGFVFRLVGLRETTLFETNNQLKELIGELQNTKADLEKRVEERTRELAKANTYNENRANLLETISLATRSMKTLQSVSELLPQITDLVSHHLGFYHVGIFLIDEEGKHAVLSASNTPGGKRMLDRGHKLKIGQEGIVGHVMSTGVARIAHDTDQDEVFYNNPDLPETRSEIALPLKVGERVIGVLDVQSSESRAISNEDIASLSILTDQISIAIQSTQQYESTIKSLEQSQTQYREQLKGEWSRLMQNEELTGYRYAYGSSTALEESLPLGEASDLIQEGKIFQREGTQASDTAELVVPVRLRGEVIGAISISIPGRHQWLDDDIDIAEAVSERLALAMENARLFQSTNRRAERERIVSEISSKISGNIRIESLLETTAQELSQALNGSEVLIQLQTASPSGGQA